MYNISKLHKLIGFIKYEQYLIKKIYIKLTIFIYQTSGYINLYHKIMFN